MDPFLIASFHRFLVLSSHTINALIFYYFGFRMSDLKACLIISNEFVGMPVQKEKRRVK